MSACFPFHSTFDRKFRSSTYIPSDFPIAFSVESCARLNIVVSEIHTKRSNRYTYTTSRLYLITLHLSTWSANIINSERIDPSAPFVLYKYLKSSISLNSLIHKNSKKRSCNIQQPARERCDSRGVLAVEVPELDVRCSLDDEDSIWLRGARGGR